MSPSVISLTRAPLSRTSAIRPVWRSRSRITTVRSRTDAPLALATQRRFCVAVAVMSIEPAASGSDRDLVHVDARPRIEHRAALADCDDRDRVGPTVGSEGGAVDRVDGDIGLRCGSVADVLAVEQHRCLVLLSFTDHDDPVHRHGGEHRAHRVDRGAVGADLVAAADPPRSRQRRRFGDTHQFEGQVAIRLLWGLRRGHARPP